MKEVEKYPDIIQAFQCQSLMINELITSEDMMEGVTAFATKRKPEWKNR
jgi:acetyl-CoA C-acetyltransferase